MKAKLQTLFLVLFSILLYSCNPDDDNPAPEEPAATVNQFTIGNDNYLLNTGFRSASFPDSPGLFVTSVFLVGDGLTLDTVSSEIVGRGNVLGLEFYTSGNTGLQAGTYNLDSINDQALTVYAYIGLDYNAQTDSATVEDDVFQGTITVEELSNGDFRITGQGRADNANASFTVLYSGNILLVN